MLEKKHRLPLSHYRGRVAVAFTACLKSREPFFVDAAVVEEFRARLQRAAEEYQCIVPVYCFMPDHFHGIFLGTSHEADSYHAMIAFKQTTGYWLNRSVLSARWQKDFYDHIVRADEDLAAQIRYIANNPVRKKIVALWSDYPYTGSIRIELATVMGDVAS